MKLRKFDLSVHIREKLEKNKGHRKIKRLKCQKKFLDIAKVGARP